MAIGAVVTAYVIVIAVFLFVMYRLIRPFDG
jgi:hypothetical protein